MQLFIWIAFYDFPLTSDFFFIIAIEEQLLFLRTGRENHLKIASTSDFYG